LHALLILSVLVAELDEAGYWEINFSFVFPDMIQSVTCDGGGSIGGSIIYITNLEDSKKESPMV